MTDLSDDRALLARIRVGDKAACAACIEQHSPEVYRLALRLMKNEAEAEDVVQETFLSAFKGIDQFDGRAELRTWLYRIAHNVALMQLRRAKMDLVSIDEASEPEDGAPVPQVLFDWCCLPEPEMDKAEVRLELEQALKAMPEKLRAVFVMRELEGMSTQAAAEALTVSAEVVKTRLRRARLWLRERLSTYFAHRAPAAPLAEEEKHG
jgi:RNA polymerase sigma-70 factor (ECF subfamily)